MSEFNLSYREVIPDQTLSEKWKEIALNTGGRQSTLQDIKVAERANGYCYRDAFKAYTRNRFIYWRISHDILEIVEQSLDVNLTGNRVRYRFIDTPILDGITIHETSTNVVILVPTVCSVHRLSFPHPNKIHKHDELLGTHPDLVVQSIFADATVAQVKNPSTFYIITNPSSAGSQLPHSAASWLTLADEEAFFLLAYPSSDILLIRQAEDGACETLELKFESILPRFLYGLAEKFRSKNSDGNVVVSMVLHTVGLETYALTLCRNGHLRVWTCSKGQCIAVSDVLSEIASGHNLVQGVQNHVLRKAVGENETDFLLAVVLNFASESQFHILKPKISGTQFRVTRINTLYSPGVDLVDFSFSKSRIWSVWRGEDGECSVYSAILPTGNGKGSHWIPAILEPIADANEVPYNQNLDPKQVYLQYIFHPGRFSLNIINKALSIYKKCTILSDVNVSASLLKERVAMAVENEIQAELQESEVNDEEYLECANWCWSRFYSCCIQYHTTGLRPLGILLLPAVSGVVLLKKSTYSILRPLDIFEHLFLCSDYVITEQFNSLPQLSDISSETVDDLIELVNVLVYLEDQLSDLFKTTFESDMSQLRSPDVVMAELITEIITDLSEEFMHAVIEKLNKCRDVYQVMHKLLELLRLEKVTSDTTFSEELQTSINHLFSSHLGTSVITQSLRQQANVRFSICRNLLALQNIILKKKEDYWSFYEAIRSVCMPEVVVFTQAYYALVWLSELPALPVIPLDSGLQKLAPLKLAPVFNLKSSTMQNLSLVDLFIGSSGGFEAHKTMLTLDFDEDTLPYWNSSLLLNSEQIMLLLWPLNGNSMFAEWLLSSGQHIWLQQYVRYLNNWCEWANLSRNFLLAAAFLTSGEHYKAYDLFLIAAKGVYTEDFLTKQITNYAHGDSNPCLLYFLKVIQLFELHGAKNYAIDVANTALTVAEENDPLKATLYSIKFKHHLSLEHYEQAYTALNSNPDSERKKDNLRDLVKTLLDRKQLDTLMSFPYVEMQELFCNILFSRARATDSIDNVYYDFLYSYQIKRGVPYMRLAAAVMYEQAFRLMQHNTVQSLEKQVKCYLAAVNALNLCEPDYAWVLKPADPDQEPEEIFLPSLAGSGLEPEKFLFSKDLEVLSLKDMYKELAIANARLRLAKFDPTVLANNLTTPQELVIFLSCAGIFKYALSLCATFDLPCDIIFEALTHQCILLTYNENTSAWNWLIENDLHDLTSVSSSPSSVAWQLLQTFLTEFEKENMSTLHRVVCEKMLNVAYFIPHWLLASYKKRNASELLRLFFYHGYLTEASNLACENILATLDHGGENFGYTKCMLPGSPPFCLPVHVIDALLYELQLQNENDSEKPVEKEYKELKEIYTKYLEVSARISNDVCRSKIVQIF